MYILLHAGFTHYCGCYKRAEALHGCEVVISLARGFCFCRTFPIRYNYRIPRKVKYCLPTMQESAYAPTGGCWEQGGWEHKAYAPTWSRGFCKVPRHFISYWNQYVNIGLRYIETVFLYSIGFYYFSSTNFS
jgi:hypothetical protein